MANKAPKSPLSISCCLILATIILVLGAFRAIDHGKNTSQMWENKAVFALNLAEKIGFSSAQGQEQLAKSQVFLANAATKNPLSLKNWLLNARIALIEALLSPLPQNQKQLEKTLSMAYMVGRHVILPSAEHRLKTALWAKQKFPAIPLPISGMKQDVFMIGEHWHIKELASLATKTSSQTFIQNALPEENTRKKAFAYYLSQAKQP